MSSDVESSTPYGMETDWSTILGSPDPSRQHRLSTPSTTIPGFGDGRGSEPDPGANQDLFDTVFSWSNSPETDVTSPYNNNSPYQHHHNHRRAESLADPTLQPSIVSWYDHADYTPSPPGPASEHNVYSSTSAPRPTTCNCFNTCLSALQALHESDTITATSPFDVILTVNQRAVETCSTMMNCSICTSKSGSSLRTMLLGTILGRIVSIYQDASKNYFALTSSQGGGQSQQLPLTFGTYRVANEDVRWLQMEIILRDLKKLKELFAKFQETTMMSDSEEDVGMHGAVSNYLCQSLDLTFESLRKQRSFNIA
ncbi:hypothetical protein WAI453_012543 [Rhynchosporium graminicola]|uniref:Aflatoxin regulatory protein domain-containing protein n=1 Tax=Rhynchosporium graminicola TaxID=2792576 RepID=A0A1E1KY58_9HELO|nr:uncharacterized protein RCO7_11337 [Rhynchosporium commune]